MHPKTTTHTFMEQNLKQKTIARLIKTGHNPQHAAEIVNKEFENVLRHNEGEHMTPRECAEMCHAFFIADVQPKY